MTFAALLVTQKREKKKVSLSLFAGRRGADPYKIKPKIPSIAKRKIKFSIRFFFCTCRRKRKSYQKENADVEISRFAKRDEDSASSTSAPFKKKVHENYN